MAWAKNYLGKRAKQKAKPAVKLEPSPNPAFVRRKVGWLSIGRTRKQVREGYQPLTSRLC